eukprot:SAG31_NODE_1426_length_8393_cov_3.363275_4_plen_178_part_00
MAAAQTKGRRRRSAPTDRHHRSSSRCGRSRRHRHRRNSSCWRPMMAGRDIICTIIYMMAGREDRTQRTGSVMGWASRGVQGHGCRQGCPLTIQPPTSSPTAQSWWRTCSATATANTEGQVRPCLATTPTASRGAIIGPVGSGSPWPRMMRLAAAEISRRPSSLLSVAQMVGEQRSEW